MNYFEIFPTLVGETILSDISLDNIENYKNHLSNLEYETSGGGDYRGTLNQQVLDDPIFSDLKFKILKYATEYLEHHGFIFEDIQIASSWGTLTHINEISQKHFHTNSYISGVYYLEDSSNINFYSPIEDKWFLKLQRNNIPHDPHTCYFQYYTPKPNSLIFFPSYLVHSIEVSKKNHRRSISFNIVPKGEIGAPTAYLKL